MKKVLINVLPWIITAAAIVYVCQGLNWQEFIAHVKTGDISYLSLAVCCTVLSYIFRSLRWKYFFPDLNKISFVQSCKVLILGFFMNNVLPARTGELVRAHMGSKVTGEKRTLVLATIASERLIDGLTISLFFLLFAIGLGNAEVSSNLKLVAYLFSAATLGVITVLIFRYRIYTLTDKLAKKLNHSVSDYALNRVQLFLEGLSPLTQPSRIVQIALLSLLIWGTELAVYVAICIAFNSNLALSAAVLFMVTVNFSSLIPSAPGALGVIEAIGTSVLVSLGLNKELALSMVLSQHIIQYLVVGIPGIIILSTWKKTIDSIEEQELQQA